MLRAGTAHTPYILGRADAGQNHLDLWAAVHRNRELVEATDCFWPPGFE